MKITILCWSVNPHLSCYIPKELLYWHVLEMELYYMEMLAFPYSFTPVFVLCTYMTYHCLPYFI
jgi:hypothetical protein